MSDAKVHCGGRRRWHGWPRAPRHRHRQGPRRPGPRSRSHPPRRERSRHRGRAGAGRRLPAHAAARARHPAPAHGAPTSAPRAGCCRALCRSIGLVRRMRPAVVVAMGGYAQRRRARIAAFIWRVPMVVAEQNAVPGAANRLIARFARAAAVSFAGHAAAPRRGGREPRAPRGGRGRRLRSPRRGPRRHGRRRRPPAGAGVRRFARGPAHQRGRRRGRRRVARPRRSRGPPRRRPSRLGRHRAPLPALERRRRSSTVPVRVRATTCRRRCWRPTWRCAARDRAPASSWPTVGLPAILVPSPHRHGRPPGGQRPSLRRSRGRGASYPMPSSTAPAWRPRSTPCSPTRRAARRDGAAIRTLARPDAAERIAALAEEHAS